VQCPDYDLCKHCEGKRIHPVHNMVRISTPGGIWPESVFSGQNKVHDTINKRTAGASADTGNF